MRRLLILGVFWLFTVGRLEAQTLTLTDLLHLVSVPPITFEQVMEKRGYTCYQTNRTISNWSCLFVNQRPLYLMQPTLAPEVAEYVFSPYTTVLVYQTKRMNPYKSWPKQLTDLGFSQEKGQPGQGVGQRFSNDQFLVILREVDAYNSISSNPSGYSISISWKRQPSALTQAY
jgi:hypothetical protein